MEPCVERLQPSLSRSAYWSDAFYHREQAAIFWDQWFCIGRDEEWTEPGRLPRRGRRRRERHRRARRGRRASRPPQPLPASRQPGCSAARASCAARFAARITPGRTPSTDRSSPRRSSSPPTCRRSASACIPSPSTRGAGSSFVNLTPSARAHGRARAARRGDPERVTRYPLAGLRAAQTIRYEVAANWKVILENYNECYHCAGVHPELCRIVPAFKRKRRLGTGLGTRHPASRRRVDVHRDRHDARAPFRGSTTTRECATKAS